MEKRSLLSLLFGLLGIVMLVLYYLLDSGGWRDILLLALASGASVFGGINSLLVKNRYKKHKNDE